MHFSLVFLSFLLFFGLVTTSVGGSSVALFKTRLSRSNPGSTQQEVKVEMQRTSARIIAKALNFIVSSQKIASASILLIIQRFSHFVKPVFVLAAFLVNYYNNIKFKYVNFIDKFAEGCYNVICDTI